MNGYPELRVCPVCLTPIRPYYRKASDYPFKTLRLGSAGRCHSCYVRGARLAQCDLDDFQYVGDPDPVTVRGYLRWLNDRNQRLGAAN